MAYTLRTEAATIYVQPFPATGAKFQISKDVGGHHALWSPDGKEIFYVPGGGPVVAVSVTTQPTFAVGNPAPVAGGLPNSSGQNPRNYDIAPNGQRFIFTAVDAGQTQSGAAAAPQIQVVLNWFEELKARVPTK